MIHGRHDKLAALLRAPLCPARGEVQHRHAVGAAGDREDHGREGLEGSKEGVDFRLADRRYDIEGRIGLAGRLRDSRCAGAPTWRAS